MALGSPSFRPYAETDMIGVEIGGAFKNVLAIAVGIVAGRALGASASGCPDCARLCRTAPHRRGAWARGRKR